MSKIKGYSSEQYNARADTQPGGALRSGFANYSTDWGAGASSSGALGEIKAGNPLAQMGREIQSQQITPPQQTAPAPATAPAVSSPIVSSPPVGSVFGQNSIMAPKAPDTLGITMPKLNPLMLKKGGKVPGKGSGDKVHAMLEPGEFVLRKAAAKKIGREKLEEMNEKGGKMKPHKKMCKGGVVRKYQTGGLVEPLTPEELGKSQWAATLIAQQGDIDPTTGKFISGKYKGKTLKEFQNLYLPQLLAAQPVDQTSKWAQIVQGQAPTEQDVPQLPPAYRNLPNAPDLSRPAPTDPMTGRRTGLGASSTAAATFKASADQLQARRNAATQAVQAARTAQIDDVAGTIDRARAARAAEQQQSGITDLGGGNMALNNQYGAGFVTTGNKPRALGSKPGAVMDENGVVDMKKSVAAGTIVNTPGNPEDLPTRAESMRTIAAGQAALAPGAADRLAADRNAQVASAQRRVNANMDSKRNIVGTLPKFSPVFAPPAKTSSNMAANVKPTTFTTTAQGLPNDTPGAASTAARQQGNLAAIFTNQPPAAGTNTLPPPALPPVVATPTKKKKYSTVEG